ncbi:MAG: tRNA-dihydrouridine synthase family protein [Pseudobdellovibrionaceae bacterium]|nr:tRNA-dihydrouridine synthase family protein [Bdellovibrionales bacterium]USN48930.1 MAG: tRNA-dihydrouridine synthase family protein [Pseudobdellovibrionaceae bacterium]
MVGLSHVAMRGLVRRYMPEGAVTLWPTEMLNSRRLPLQKVGETPETLKSDGETHLMPQILGNDEDNISRSLRKLEPWGAVGVDINMGCPVQKALKHNYGVALMGDADYAAKVVAMTVKHSKGPVSVKLRAGDQGDFNYLSKFSQGLVDAGAAWLCLHPRTAGQKRRGNADWSQIAELKKSISVPIIGNGDVQVAEDALQMFEQTGCDGVMIGRALTARPWMLWQLGAKWGWPNPPGFSGDPPKTGEEEAQAYGEALKFLLNEHQKYFAESLGLRKFLFFVKVSSPWLNFGHPLFAKVSGCKTYVQAAEILNEFFKSSQLRMTDKTNLRY